MTTATAPVAHAAAIAAQLQGAATARRAQESSDARTVEVVTPAQPGQPAPTVGERGTVTVLPPADLWTAEPCPDCTQPIRWALTTNGKRMPVDGQPHDAGNLHLKQRGDQLHVDVLGQTKVADARTAGIALFRHHRLTCAKAANWTTPPTPVDPANPRGYPPEVLAELDQWVGNGPGAPATSQRAAETAQPHRAEQHAVTQLAATGAALPPLAAAAPEPADVSPLPDLTPWTTETTGRDADPEQVGRDLVEAFRLGILAGDIRGRQREIGPSGLGHPCSRAIAYLLAGTPPTGQQATPWRQAVGTAMHERGDLWAHLDNERRGTRWLTNLRVSVGELYPGRDIRGTLDYLDVHTATVLDLKVPGTTAMKTYGHGKPESPQYRVQLHAYARGVQRAGFLPAHVGVLRVSPARELDEAIFKVEPYDEQIAVDALTRVGGIARMVDAIGPAAAAALPPTEHHCARCDWFAPGATDLTTGCPGAPGAVKPRRDQLDTLVS